MEFIIDADPIDTPATDPGERPLVPAGVQTLTIRSAEEGVNDYKKTDENPDGVCLKLRLASGGNHRFVFDDLPIHLGWRAKQLAAAVGIVPVGERLVLKPEELEGQAVSVEITHYTSKAGKVSAVVKRYLPAADKPSPTASKVAAKRPSPSAVKLPANFPDDEIPFAWLLPFILVMWGA